LLEFNAQRSKCLDTCIDPSHNYDKKAKKCQPKPVPAPVVKKVEIKAVSIEIKKKNCVEGEKWSESDKECRTVVVKKSVSVTVNV